jgi:hypothetical protein
MVDNESLGDEQDKINLALLQAPITFTNPYAISNRKHSGAFLFRRNGGGLKYNLPWAYCAGPVKTWRIEEGDRFYTFFPESWVPRDVLLEWLAFVTNALGIPMSLVGVVNIKGNYLQEGMDYPRNSYERCYVINLHNEADLTLTKYYPLLKLTLLRYIYYPYHYDAIIKHVLRMVNDHGFNPYEALVLAHVMPTNDIVYESRLGLIHGQYLPFPYPRDRAELSKLMQYYKMPDINHIFSPLDGSAPINSLLTTRPHGLVNERANISSMSNTAVFHKKQAILLPIRKHIIQCEYEKALELFHRQIKRFLPFFENNPPTTLNYGEFWFKLPEHAVRYHNYIINFIKSI